MDCVQGKRSNSDESSVDFDQSAVRTELCSICLDRVPVTSMLPVQCTQDHMFCRPCLYMHVRYALLDVSADQLPHIPSCPCCRDAISPEVVNLIVEGHSYRARTGSWTALVQERGDRRAMTTRMAHLARNQQLRDAKYIRCPSCPAVDYESVHWVPRATLQRSSHVNQTPAVNPAKSAWSWFAPKPASPPPEDPLPPNYDPYGLSPMYAPQRVDCPRCSTSFCSHCLSSPYHYAIGCRAYPSRVEAWRKWRTEDEGSLMAELLASSAAISKAEAGRQLAAIKAAMTSQAAQLRADEEFKAQHCRHCPSCARIIEKVAGCDLMICGQNFHGGGQQQGCGAKFSWSSARRYVPHSIPAQGELGWAEWAQSWWFGDRYEQRKRQAILSGVHMIDVATPMCCDGCRLPIRGPRVHCLNCPSTDLCLACAAGPTQSPAVEAGSWLTQALRALVREPPSPCVSIHTQSHFCEVIMAK